MKKVLFVACAFMLSIGAFAQKGQSAVSVNFGATPCLEQGVSLTNYGVAAKYQYGFTDGLRGEVVLSYDFKSEGIGFLEAGINVDYLFNIGSKFAIYPLIGVGYANIQGGIDFDFDDYSLRKSKKYDDDDYSSSINRFYVNAGLGAEYMISKHVGINLEVKYQYIKNFSRLPISLGVTYKF